MKKLVIILFIGMGFALNAQSIDYNTSKGYALEGYDVVAYFSNTAKKGNSSYTATHDNVKYKFATQANRDAFKANPEKYLPQYGGYCAYAVGARNKKVTPDPETFEIRDGKLFVFYKSWRSNTLNSWIKEGPAKLKAKADKNWETLKVK
ncbi:hypothetical protein GTQ40_10050 [Flavobacteriaceae bacterium R38]|nr:hypothetical protein [Flavobacteriaceae bacterium R38]